jgi:hypothetical protein
LMIDSRVIIRANHVDERRGKHARKEPPNGNGSRITTSSSIAPQRNVSAIH